MEKIVKVSVIVPVYNVEKYIAECIDSVLNQTLDNIEIIIVNDGSTDNSGSICLDYAKKYPKSIKYIDKENEGVSVARNLGLSYANGEFVHFLDSDDTIDECFYETCYNIAQNEKSNFVLVSDTFDKKYLKHLYCYTAWALFIRKSVLDVNKWIRFPEGIQPAEDGIFVHKLTSVLKGNGYSLNTISKYNYRVHVAGDHIKNRNNTDKLYNQIKKWLDHLGEFYKDTELYKTRSFYFARFLNKEPLGRMLVIGYSKDQIENLTNKFFEIYDEFIRPYISTSEGGSYKNLPLRLRLFIKTRNIKLVWFVNKIIALILNIIPSKKIRRNLRWKYL
ncbi:glycosyltransferase [bacterium]|nr:glycosyltransferase [bacterium]